MLTDPALALLDARVAEAAEAWLTDPRDVGVYERLLAAVAARRAHRRVGADAIDDPADEGPDDDRVEAADADDLEGTAAERSSLRAVGDLLDARDARAALDRLRGAR